MIPLKIWSLILLVFWTLGFFVFPVALTQPTGALSARSFDAENARPKSASSSTSQLLSDVDNIEGVRMKQQDPTAPIDNPPPAQIDNPPPAQIDNPPPAQIDNPPPAQIDNPPANPAPAPIDNPPAVPVVNPPPAQIDIPPPAQVANPTPAPIAVPPPAPLTNSTNLPAKNTTRSSKQAKGKTMINTPLGPLAKEDIDSSVNDPTKYNFNMPLVIGAAVVGGFALILGAIVITGIGRK
ncbi:hypothetical protein BKA69DRAFT_1125065 [Paraphysoderma sedebokerense]|nr:hypothetical protein BKA69DRAFT_1125065 [Paraphysoderma sedebokerense]